MSGPRDRMRAAAKRQMIAATEIACAAIEADFESRHIELPAPMPPKMRERLPQWLGPPIRPMTKPTLTILRRVQAMPAMSGNGFTEYRFVDECGKATVFQISGSASWWHGAMLCGLEPLECGQVS